MSRAWLTSPASRQYEAGNYYFSWKQEGVEVILSDDTPEIGSLLEYFDAEVSAKAEFEKIIILVGHFSANNGRSAT
jgi:hypothetical protein